MNPPRIVRVADVFDIFTARGCQLFTNINRVFGWNVFTCFVQFLPVFSGSLLLSGLQVVHSPAAVGPDDVQLCPVPLLQALLVHLPVRLSVAVFLHHTEISLPQYPADICPPD